MRAKIATVLLALALVLSTSVPASASLNLREHRVIHWTNHARVVRGIPALREGAPLHLVALHEVHRMIRCRCLTHTVQPPCKYWGQNIGVGPTARAVFKGFMASVPHRANILNRNFHRLGVAVRRAAGVVWVSQEFCG